MNAFGVVLISIVTAAATAAGTVYTIQRNHLFEEPPEQKASVPSLIGLSEADAKTNLEAIGLKLMIGGREPTSAAEPGTVVKQAPEAGQQLSPGAAVNLTIAVALPKVPDVAGKTVDEATKTLEAAGFTVSVGEPVPSETVEKGMVVEQEPKGGAGLQKAGVVKIAASAGRDAVEIPKLVGLGLKNAEAAAQKSNLKLQVQWVSLAETATYVVLRQTPSPGESASPDTEVKVVVNR